MNQDASKWTTDRKVYEAVLRLLVPLVCRGLQVKEIVLIAKRRGPDEGVLFYTPSGDVLVRLTSCAEED